MRSHGVHSQSPDGRPFASLLRRPRLREREERQREVREAALERLERLAQHDLVQLEADEARHERGRRRDRGDDLARDEPRLVHVRLGDLVVARAQVRARRHEGHVLVDVLVELDGLQAVARERRGRRQRAQDRRALLVDVGELAAEGRGRARSSLLRLLLLLLGLLLVRRDLDAVARREVGHDHVGQDREERLVVERALDAVVERAQVRGRLDELEVEPVGRVERERRGRPLRARPEGLARRRKLVGREVVQQLRDRVVEALLEAQPRPHDAVVERDGPRVDEARLDLAQRLELRVGLLRELRAELLARAREVRVHVLGVLHELALVHVARPLQRVLDLVREVLERAHRDALLGRVARRAVPERERESERSQNISGVRVPFRDAPRAAAAVLLGESATICVLPFVPSVPDSSIGSW